MSIILRSIKIRPPGFLARYYNKIVITDDETTIVALHKASGFPYEHSRPLPDIHVEDNTVMKMNDIDEVKRVFKSMSQDMSIQHLSKITNTTKHRWYPRARDKKAKKTEMNRPFL